MNKNHRVGNKHWNARSETRASAKFYADRNAAAVSRRVGEARSRLCALEEEQIRKPPTELSFRGLGRTSRPRSGPVLVADSVAVPGRLPTTSLSIRGGEKWLVTGDNGAGKSTLLRLLSGDLAPATGSLWRPHALRVGVLGQHPALAHVEGSAADFYARSVGSHAARQSPLEAWGLLGGGDAQRPAAELSLGQQRRLELAVALARRPDVLVLDEPTNHLSLHLVEQLEAALRGFPGAVVLASHDRWLRDSWAGRRLHLSGPE
ncbi:ATP-binding cassette domain-containing protein [Corynebacterium mastitidis]|uniref:ATP-binding cassette domain-containing protein n=1 Tax=Corynebacterium mastitidis TaxID=161890 RepID=UPI001F1328B5|nr:ATP-binding cassette domain-containing protein [Corynebacterium mastitidis]MCH6196857.1 ATP-binding cassette domain-containing protein [Corynebacterium mastitidis]